MQTVEVEQTVQAAAVKVLQPPRERTPLEPLVGRQHRIYVWSSPSPYAVVIQESRSFHI